MDAIGSTKMARSQLSRRLLREKESLRDDLRARAPQATNLPEPVDEEDEDGSNSDFDESEDDDTDGDESDDDEQSQPQPQPPPPDITDSPPPVTLTHAPEPTSNPSDEPSDTLPPPPPADESSSATDLSSTLIPTTTTFASLPSDTALSSETENLDTIQGSSTASAGTDSAVPTVDPDSGSDDVSDGGSPDRAKDIGIILGTLALASLLIIGGVLLYRWRLRRKAQNSGDVLSEKDLTTSRGTDQIGLVDDYQGDGQRGVDHYSSWAVFDSNPTGGGPTSFYNGDDNSTLDRRPSQTDITQGMPLPPPPAAVTYKPYHREEQDQNGVSPLDSPVSFQMQGAADDDVSQLRAPHASAGQGQSLGVFPPGSGHRQSLAQTEGTESTEGTWRTWGVDQNQATHTRTWKDRYLT